jgi:hypothetical protein
LSHARADGGCTVSTGTRRNSRITVAGLQAPRPLGVGTPRAVNALAIPVSVATPAARTSAITGRRSVARAVAFADFAAAAMRICWVSTQLVLAIYCRPSRLLCRRTAVGHRTSQPIDSGGSGK